MTDSAEVKESETIESIENELKQLKRQLHKIEEEIRQKNVELSTVMARAVSVTDIDEILGLDREISDISMERTESTENEGISGPKCKTDKVTKKKKKKKKGGDKNRKAQQLWKELENQINDGNIEYLKKLIQLKKVKINDNTQYNGRTMLMMAAEHGQYDICNMLINMGADVTMKTKYDTRDASYFANKFGHYHIQRLLLISSFGGESSAKINENIEKLKQQKAMNQDFIKLIVENNDNNNNNNKWIEEMINYLCQLIENKMIFSDDILSICWNYIEYKYKQNALNSDLWKIIIKSCDDVIQSKDSNNWYWFKHYMLKSTIWLKSDPTKNKDDDKKKGDDDGDYYNNISLNGLLIQRLFDITNKQSIKNSDSLKKMESKFNLDWKELINFDIKTKYGLSPRQDTILNGLKPKYSKEELSQNINPSTTFNPLKYYDINQYLPNLLLLNHMINDKFQECVMNIFNINSVTNTNISDFSDETDIKTLIKYRRGPIKQISRCKAKAENDYKGTVFPSSTHLLDIIRCTLTYHDVNYLLKSLNEFEAKINNNNNNGVIKAIVRSKNGFKDWNSNHPNYTDIKLNVICLEKDDEYAVIGEIQILLHDMSVFKLSSHKLYNIIRLDEEYLNLLKIKPIIMDHEKCLLNASYFNDSKEISNLMVVHGKNIDFIANKIDLSIILKTNGIKLLKIFKEYMSINILISKLRSCGGFQIVCSKGYMNMIQYIYLYILPSDTDEYDDMLKNGLTEIINNGYFEILTWMFTQNKFLKLWNKYDYTEKHAFFIKNCELGTTNCCKLIRKKCEKTFDPNIQSSDGYCALMKAIRYKQIDTVKWLINLPNIDLLNENERKGRICLFEALDVGCIEIADLLLSQCKNPKNMLMYKASFGHTIQVFVMSAGRRGNKKKEAIVAVKKWAKQYDVVELQIIQFNTQNVKFSSM